MNLIQINCNLTLMFLQDTAKEEKFARKRIIVIHAKEENIL